MSLGLCAAIRQVEVALIAEIVGRRLGADCFEATWHCQAPLFAVIPACLPHPSPHLLLLLYHSASAAISGLFNFDVNADSAHDALSH